MPQYVVAAATVYSAYQAKKSADRGRKLARQAQTDANAAADAALEEAKQARLDQSDYFNQSMADSSASLVLLTQSQKDNSAKRQEMINAYNDMVDVQRGQFTTAQEQLKQESARYEEQRADAAKREAALEKEITDRRNKDIQEEQASARARRLRGGKRGLLNSLRLNSETGIKTKQTTLGA